jgi:hypothetical protein
MEQQVNLYQPILGSKKKLFSAHTIGLCLAVSVVLLAGIGAYSTWRAGRTEHLISELEQRQADQLARVENAGAAIHTGKSAAELDAEAKDLSADIAARERALELVRQGASSVENGFAARLESLARRQVDGLWLKSIVVVPGNDGLALRGETVDGRLVPAYLAAIAEEHALTGVRFERLAMHRAKKEDAPAQLAFELVAPGLALPSLEEHP